MVSSLDYVLYSIRARATAEGLMRDPTAVDALLEALKEGGPIPPAVSGPWGASHDFSFYDHVRDGAFCAVRDHKKFPLRVLDGCPVVYANAKG